MNTLRYLIERIERRILYTLCTFKMFTVSVTINKSPDFIK